MFFATTTNREARKLLYTEFQSKRKNRNLGVGIAEHREHNSPAFTTA